MLRSLDQFDAPSLPWVEGAWFGTITRTKGGFPGFLAELWQVIKVPDLGSNGIAKCHASEETMTQWGAKLWIRRKHIELTAGPKLPDHIFLPLP